MQVYGPLVLDYCAYKNDESIILRFFFICLVLTILNNASKL